MFVGRCVDYILCDYFRCVNIFVFVFKEVCIERLMYIYYIFIEVVEELMEKVDKKWLVYYNYYSYKMWGVVEIYYLCIDLFVLGIDGIV